MDSNVNSKKKVGLIIAVVFVLAVFIAGVIALLNRKDDAPVSTTNEVRVSITEDGFSPATISINAGATVVWSNDTAEPHKVGANPYPDASSLPDLKSEEIAPGDSYSYTFRASGTYGYADYTKPTVSGSVQVK